MKKAKKIMEKELNINPCPLCNPNGNVPNKETIKAIKEAREGKLYKYNSIKELMEKLKA